MPNILVVDKETRTRERIAHFFQGNGHEVFEAESSESAAEIIRSRTVEVIVVDVALENGSIIQAIRQKVDYLDQTSLIATAYQNEIESAMKAVREGAHDYLSKPFSVAELYLKVEKALEMRRLKLETQNLRGEQPFIYKVNEFIGNSPQIKGVLKLVGKVANSNSSVIITGETGTGKELVAGLIHYNSYRRKNAFVRVNCAALHEELLESELFGHEKGSFTGATHLRIGKFEQADQGTIFLDEIGDMSMRIQTKLLRVLQEREFERLGGNATIKIDVRVISATNKNLKKEVEEGRFREDLYYRLNVVTLHLPPLRERREDIYALVHFFVSKFSSEMNKKIETIDPETMEHLLTYDWPGNIRELRNCVERAILLAESNALSFNDFRIESAGSSEQSAQPVPFTDLNLEEMEKKAINIALNQSHWSQKEAAELLGISRRALNYKIQKYGFKHTSWRRNA